MNDDDVLVNIMKAAVLDAVESKKLIQFKTAVFTNSGPKFARIIVVPEEMERQWPVDAPLGSTSKKEAA
jgi:hypothetical protein